MSDELNGEMARAESQISEDDWLAITSTIEAGKCIVIVGPEVFTDDQGRSLAEQISDKLSLPKNPNITEYPDGLYYCKNRQERSKFCIRLENFYQQHFSQADAIHDKLAQIPFHLMLSLTPDKKLFESVHEVDPRTEHDFYYKMRPPSKEDFVPKASQPMVYNMFGSIEQHESMVLTHTDLFSYFESVFGSNSMAETLKLQISKARNLIFLGVRFDRWYMQLILRILYLHTNEDLLRYATNLSPDNNIRELAREHFRITIISDDIGEFVEALYQRCKGKGMLKVAGQIDNQQVIRELRSRIDQELADDNLEEAIDYIFDFIDQLDLLNPDSHRDELTSLDAKGRRLKRKRKKGTISEDDFGVSWAQLREDIRDTIKNLDRELR